MHSAMMPPPGLEIPSTLTEGTAFSSGVLETAVDSTSKIIQEPVSISACFVNYLTLTFTIESYFHSVSLINEQANTSFAYFGTRWRRVRCKKTVCRSTVLGKILLCKEHDDLFCV